MVMTYKSWPLIRIQLKYLSDPCGGVSSAGIWCSKQVFGSSPTKAATVLPEQISDNDACCPSRCLWWKVQSPGQSVGRRLLRETNGILVFRISPLKYLRSANYVLYYPNTQGYFIILENTIVVFFINDTLKRGTG